LATLEKADVPHGRATPLGELQDDPHMKAVEFFKVYDHPTEGKLRLTDPPIKFSKTPSEIRRLPALLGEHSIEILREAGLSDVEIGEMMDEGVTLDGRPEAEKIAAE
ncbi:MAG: CoA transferase, partial [Pseudomonadota bacterium]|nr:CoA transferase [Pseudomonadota bacterium]